MYKVNTMRIEIKDGYNGQILIFHFQWYQEHKLFYTKHVNIALS